MMIPWGFADFADAHLSSVKRHPHLSGPGVYLQNNVEELLGNSRKISSTFMVGKLHFELKKHRRLYAEKIWET